MDPMLLAIQPANAPPDGENRVPAGLARKRPDFAGMVQEALRRKTESVERELPESVRNETPDAKSRLLEQKGGDERLAAAAQAALMQPAESAQPKAAARPDQTGSEPVEGVAPDGQPVAGAEAKAANAESRQPAVEAKTAATGTAPAAHGQAGEAKPDAEAVSVDLGMVQPPVENPAVSDEPLPPTTGGVTDPVKNPLPPVTDPKPGGLTIDAEAMAQIQAEAPLDAGKPGTQPVIPPAVQGGQPQTTIATVAAANPDAQMNAGQGQPQNGTAGTNQPAAAPADSTQSTQGVAFQVHTTQGHSAFEPARLSEARAPEFLPQIREALQGMRRIGENVLKLSLAPEELGQIELRIANRPEGLAVTILAERSATASLLEKYLGDLRRDLQQSGLTLNDVFIGQSGEQHQQQANQSAFAAQLRRRHAGASDEAENDIQQASRAPRRMEEGALDLRI